MVSTEIRLPISECFGPTLQGEGPAAGQCASFVRFMGCNLSCSWCDTSYTWDGHRHDLRNGTMWLTPAEVAGEVLGHGSHIVVVTGGEPLLQQDRPGWDELLSRLVNWPRRIHIETNGTVVPSRTTLGFAEVICVSPKLVNAGAHRGHQDPTPRPEFGELAAAHPCLHLKVVCQDTQDVHATAQLARSLRWPRERVWVMPEGTTGAVLGERWPVIAQAAAEHGINASHRLHVLAWGDERGR